MAVTKNQIKTIARKHIRAMLTRTGVTIGHALTRSVDANGVSQYTMQPQTGNIQPDDAAVEAHADMFASVIMDVLPLLTVATTVVVDTGAGMAQGKGAGTIS